MRTTLDTLAFEAGEVTIVGEHDFAVRAHLIAGEPDRAGARSRRSSPIPSRSPSARASCASACRGPSGCSASSTAEAVRLVCESRDALPAAAAIGARAAAELYGGTILAEGIEDEPNNVTRFVWIAPAGTEPQGSGEWKTSLVFSELGEDHPGALVDALREFSSRGVNLTPDRVAAPAPGPRPLHVLLRPRGMRWKTTRWPRQSSALREQG